MSEPDKHPQAGPPDDGPTAEWYAALAAEDADPDPFAQPTPDEEPDPAPQPPAPAEPGASPQPGVLVEPGPSGQPVAPGEPAERDPLAVPGGSTESDRFGQPALPGEPVATPAPAPSSGSVVFDVSGVSGEGAPVPTPAGVPSPSAAGAGSSDEPVERSAQGSFEPTPADPAGAEPVQGGPAQGQPARVEQAAQAVPAGGAGDMPDMSGGPSQGGPAQGEPAQGGPEGESAQGPLAAGDVSDASDGRRAVETEDRLVWSAGLAQERQPSEPAEARRGEEAVASAQGEEAAASGGVEALVAAAQLQAAEVPAEAPAEPPADTVAGAEETPDRAQPYAELGLREDEYQRVRDILGRRPTSAELAIYSVMWSEHCSYKSSKVHLRQFADKAPQTDALLVGMGENAGVVDIGHGWAVTFKVESHNHPSYVEPYQGAATGVGGIVRDIISMGARPVAVMDSLRFGPADAPDTQRVLPGVVAGIGGYGNSLGLPNIGGETVFDPCYLQNPLVNALCVGVLRHDDIKRAAAPGPGNKVILFGAHTGPDGIGGASVLASATFDDESQAKRPSVQVGDPFTEKLLIECCMELFGEDLVVGIQDLGAAGVSCATTELAAAGTGGMHVVLDAVPLRDPTLRPEEILMSESQERMMAVVEPAKVDRFMEICARWEIPATVIGEVTGTGRLVMTWRGEVIVDIPPGTAADEGPVYERPYEPPADLAALQADTPGRLARPSNAEELRKTVLWLAGSPNLGSKAWVTSQYDRYVLGNTVLAMPEDAGVLRVDGEAPQDAPSTALGIALSLDGNGRYTRLDPYSGAQLALSEAYRNVAATGARPLAVTNCLNFGSPEDPGVMWQFARAVEGLADACQALGVPVTGGNVSFYNQTGTTPINPTPVVGVLGVHDDVRRRVNMALAAEGHVLVLLGETREEFGGSEWAHVVYDHLGGLPPLVDLAAEKALAAVLAAGAREGLLSAAHDLSDGGLSQALVESCLRGGLGCRITLPGDPFVALFSESVARALVAVRPGAEGRVAKLCEAAGVPVTQLGVTGGDALTVEGLFSIPLMELRDAHEVLVPSYAT